MIAGMYPVVPVDALSYTPVNQLLAYIFRYAVVSHQL